MKRPLTCVNLIKAIGTLSAGQDPVRLSRAMANVIVAQMLPDGVVKGGSSLLFRYDRRRQPWPAAVTALPSWDDLYVLARNNLLDNADVLPTAAEAVAWANELVRRIEAGV